MFQRGSRNTAFRVHLAKMTPCVVALQFHEIFHEDAVFYDPKGGVFRGRDETDRIAGVIKATPPDFEYQPLFPPEEIGDAGRVRLVSGTPGKPPAYAGTDFIVARNGRIASVRGVSVRNFICKLLNVRSPKMLKLRKITLLFLFNSHRHLRSSSL